MKLAKTIDHKTNTVRKGEHLCVRSTCITLTFAFFVCMGSHTKTLMSWSDIFTWYITYETTGFLIMYQTFQSSVSIHNSHAQPKISFFPLSCLVQISM